MEEKEILKKTAQVVTDKPVYFDIDIAPRNFLHKLLQSLNIKPKKRFFSVKGLTANQVYLISEILLELDAGKLTPDDILKLFRQLPKVAEILAISVTPSRDTPSKELVQFFMHNLNQAEMHRLVTIVLDKFQAIPFLTTILSLRNLNLLNLKSPQAQAEIIAPGILSVA